MSKNKRYEKIVVLGAGESGTGAAILAIEKGLDVFVSDNGKIKDKYKKLLDSYRIEYEEKGHSQKKILLADEVIKSPGIPDDIELISKLKKKQTPIISEIEFAGRYTRAVKICITGSNGKTTTTSLIFHMMKKAGLNVGMTGNVGNSLAKQVAIEDYDYYVIELSSFQLDNMYNFKADIAVLMNITPDHLDRYGYDFDRYVDSKFRVIRNQGKNDSFIFCGDDEIILRELKKREIAGNLLSFSLDKSENQASFIQNNMIHTKTDKNKIMKMTIDELALLGKHNIYNSMAASIAGQVLHIRKETIRESLSDFQGVEHRLEPFIKVHGIWFVNDSKATNVNSTWYALESMKTPVVWIVGGIDKGNDYSGLISLVKEKVKAIICLGKDNSKIHKAYDEIVADVVDSGSMEEAVRTSYYYGKKGDTVLLSPACASFDLFDNYEDRGRQFKKAVRNL